MGVLFLVPNPGCSGAENELLLSLVLFFVFCYLHPVCAAMVSGGGEGGVLLILERKQK